MGTRSQRCRGWTEVWTTSLPPPSDRLLVMHVPLLQWFRPDRPEVRAGRKGLERGEEVVRLVRRHGIGQRPVDHPAHGTVRSAVRDELPACRHTPIVVAGD